MRRPVRSGGRDFVFRQPPREDAQGNLVIVAAGLIKKYGRFTAVDGLDLSIRQGEIFGLLGPNGAGKTTTILMLLGLTEPTSGTVSVCGFDPVRAPLSVKSVVGYLPDNVGFYPNLTGRENLRYTASLNRIPRREADDHISTLLHEVGLAQAADKPAGTYSRGMRQRLAIADALIKRPSVLILDEPTIGIDPEGVRDLLAMLNRLCRQQGMTILLSSHLLHQVQEVCDRVGIFVRGRLIAVGPIRELQEELALHDEFELDVVVTDADGRPADVKAVEDLLGALESLPGVINVRVQKDVLTVRSKRDVRVEAARALREHDLIPLEFHRRGLTLDEIYDWYFREESPDEMGQRHAS